MAYRKHAYVLVFDGFDDHGVSAMLESVRNVAGYRVIAFGLTETAVTAASGLRVLAEGSPDVIDLARAGLFVLPAGALWEQPQRNASRDLVTAAVTDLLQSFDEAAVPLAAIGSGVTALARVGLLDGVNHTAASARYLETHVPGFSSSGFYVPAAALSDQNIVTARPDAARDLAEEVTALLLHARFSPEQETTHAACAF